MRLRDYFCVIIRDKVKIKISFQQRSHNHIPHNNFYLLSNAQTQLYNSPKAQTPSRIHFFLEQNGSRIYLKRLTAQLMIRVVLERLLEMSDKTKTKAGK